MFKKATGQTYIGYLTDVRLNKAVELLNKTDDKTYVIAAKVGYQEQNYFSYVFKKKFGVSPTRYRTAHRSGEAKWVKKGRSGRKSFLTTPASGL